MDVNEHVMGYHSRVNAAVAPGERPTNDGHDEPI